MHSFELPLSICVFYRRIFNLEIQNSSLENHHIMNARQPFCRWMTFIKVSNPFLPSPSKWLALLWGRRISPKPLWSWKKQFFLRHITVLYIYACYIHACICYMHMHNIVRHERYFFSAGYFSPRNLFARFFPHEISLQDIFFEITH